METVSASPSTSVSFVRTPAAANTLRTESWFVVFVSRTATGALLIIVTLALLSLFTKSESGSLSTVIITPLDIPSCPAGGVGTIAVYMTSTSLPCNKFLLMVHMPVPVSKSVFALILNTPVAPILRSSTATIGKATLPVATEGPKFRSLRVNITCWPTCCDVGLTDLVSSRSITGDTVTVINPTSNPPLPSATV